MNHKHLLQEAIHFIFVGFVLDYNPCPERTPNDLSEMSGMICYKLHTSTNINRTRITVMEIMANILVHNQYFERAKIYLKREIYFSKNHTIIL